MKHQFLSKYDHRSQTQRTGLQIPTSGKAAVQAAATAFPGSQTQHNDIADAYRHAVWNALNSKDIGSSEAELFGNAHEDFPANPPIEKSMDLTNNQIGRNIATTLLNANPNISESSILSYIQIRRLMVG